MRARVRLFVRHHERLAMKMLMLALLISACHRTVKEAPVDPFLAVSDPGRAIEASQQRLKANPDDPGAWRDLGTAHAGLGQPEKAAEAFEEAVRLQPESPEVWAQLALAYRSLERHAEAGMAYGNALKRSPQSTEYLAAYRELLERQGRQSEVVRTVSDHVAYGESGIALLNRLARDYFRSGAYSASEDAAVASLALRRNQPETLKLWARALEEQTRYAEAQKAYEEAGKGLEGDPEVGLGEARCARALGQIEASEAAYQRVLSLDPQQLEALYGLVQLKLDLGDPDEASTLLRRALAQAPDAPLLQLAQAEIYRLQGNPAQALSLLRITASQSPDLVEVTHGLARAYLTLNEPDQALKVLEESRGAADHPMTQRLRCHIWLLKGQEEASGPACKDIPAPTGLTPVDTSLKASTHNSLGNNGKDVPMMTGDTHASERVNARKTENPGRSPGSSARGRSAGEGGKPATAAASDQRSDTGAEARDKPGARGKPTPGRVPDVLRPQMLPTDKGGRNPAAAKESFQTGLSYFRSRDLMGAADAFRQAIQDDPLVARYRYNLGVVYAEMRQYELGAESFKEALALNPGDLDALHNLGAILLQLERYDDAATAFQYALQQKPGDREALKGLGAAYEGLGQDRKARETYDQAGEEPPLEEVED